MMASEVARPKRSLSSSMRSFFRSAEKRDPAGSCAPELLSPRGQPHVEQNMEPTEESEPVGGSLIIYEGDEAVRPPVLPILPVQRLRLLRQKQEWRRRHTFELISSNPLQLNISNYSYKSSSTPSPMKLPVKIKDINPPLKKKKLPRGTARGTKWSGDFAYDLAEYDTTAGKAASPGRESPSGPVAKAKNTVVQDANSDRLSTTQRNALLNGSQLVVKRQQAPAESQGKKHAGPVKGEKVVLPSVGFDFIKGGDTPSKVKAPMMDEQDEEPRRKRRIGMASTPAGGTSGENGTEKSKILQFDSTLGDKKDQASKKPSPFSFDEKKDGLKRPNFGLGSGQDKQPRPAFNFNQKNETKESKPEFTFGNTVAKTEKTKPAFSFTTKKPNSEDAKPAFSFGEKKDGTVGKPTFSFGNGVSTVAAKKDESADKPKLGFSFGAGSGEKLALTSANKSNGSAQPKPAFSFGAAKGNGLEGSKPTFGFGGAKNEEPKPDNKQDEKPLFSLGSGLSKDSPKPSLTPEINNKETNAASDKPDSFVGVGSGKPDESKKRTASKGFSFNRISEPAAGIPAASAPPATPSFTFGAGANDKPASSGPSVFAPAPKAANKPFTFSNANSGQPWSAGSTTSTTNNNNALPFNFKLGTGAATPASSAPPAPPANGSVSNPFVKNHSGFAFNNNNGGAAGFNAAQPVQTQQQPVPGVAPLFGIAHSVSPVFGKSTSPPVIPNSNPSSRAFTPSNTINLNFGNVGSADPSAIFSGAAMNSQPSSMGAPNPQQIFSGGSQPPAQVFGGGSQPFNGGGFGGVGPGLVPNPVQQPVTNFQIPAGRKLARMRQSRRG